MRILQNNTIAVLIDVQERLFPHIHEHEILKKNISILLQGLHALDIPVIVTEQYTKGLGTTIPSLREILPEYSPIEKISFSCSGCDEFNQKILSYEKKNILLFGIEAHVCVLQTALDLLKENFLPVLIEDCVSSRKQNDKQIAIQRMRQEGAIISSYESILFELCRTAGTNTFKQISMLVK